LICAEQETQEKEGITQPGDISESCQWKQANETIAELMQQLSRLQHARSQLLTVLLFTRMAAWQYFIYSPHRGDSCTDKCEIWRSARRTVI